MCDVALMDYDSLGSFQSGLGSAAVIVMDKSTDMVGIPSLFLFYSLSIPINSDLTRRWLQFAISLTSTCTSPAVSARLAVKDCPTSTISCVVWSVDSWRSVRLTC